MEIVRSSFFNYFEIVEHLRSCPPSNSLLELVKPELTQEENDQLLISHEAFCLDEELIANIRSREVNVIKLMEKLLRTVKVMMQMRFLM